jgi:hypothetical protein
MEELGEEHFRISFDEFCNSLFIIGHFYHKKLLLYENFTLKESLDDFLHHLLNHFNEN